MPRYEFDVKPVQYLVAAKKERVFKRAGAFIRADARQSIRVSIRNSKPGEPPKAKGRAFKNSVAFAADKESVVTGPIRAKPANSTPHILEAGGMRSDKLGKIRARWERANPEEAREQRKQRKAAQRAAGKKNQPERERSEAEKQAIRRKMIAAGKKLETLTDEEYNRIVTFRIAPRPYMEPALRKNKQKVLALMSK